MRQILISILFILCTVSLYSQEEVLIAKSYPAQSFESLAKSLQQDEGLLFFYEPAWVDSLNTQAIAAGTPVEKAMNTILQGTGLSFYQEQKLVYVFQGEQILNELPDFKTISETDSEIGSSPDKVAQEGDQYLQTKSMSEENFLTVGSEERAVKGRACRVRGTISSQQNGEALIGATVYVKETQTGTITDVEGVFQLSLLPGTYRILVNHMAMKEVEYGLNVLSNGNLHIELENDLIELQEITVTDKRTSNVESMLMGFDRISTKSIKEVPVVLGEKDVIKIIQMLPGVQNSGEGSSGFNVRGGSADQNMFYINKISIYNTSHLFGFFTAFSPDIVSDFSLYKNNVPAKYGGRIASIFEVSTRQGNKNEFFVQGGISPITARIAAEGPIVKEKVSFVASLRSTYSDWILKRMNDYDLRNSNAMFNDATLGFNARVNPNNEVNVFLYRSSDRFSLSAKEDYKYSNTGASLSWDHKFSKGLSSEFSVSSSVYSFSTVNKNNVTEAFSHDYSVRHTEARADFLSVNLDKHRIEFGANAILYNLNRGDILPYGEESTRIPISLGNEQGIESALYVSDEFRLLPRLNLLLGLRYSYFAQLGPAEVNLYEEGKPKNKYSYEETVSYNNGEMVKSYSGFEPRAALNFRVAPSSSVKASYSRLQQYIFLLSNTVAVAPNDQWKLTDYHISPPKSDQVSVGYYHDFRDAGINVSVEVYKKWVSNVVEYRDGADFISTEPLETQVLQGSQDSKGIEFMVKKNTKRLTGWVSYTYSRSTVQVDGEYDEQKINNGVPYSSNFDIPHSFNFVSNYRISKRLSFSSNIVYSTGRPVTLPVATYYADDRPFMLYSSRNAYRIPNYFRVDLSVNLEGNLKFKKVAHSYWMLNIYNLTGRNNAYSVYYTVEGDQIQGHQLSIFARPIVTISWNFKFGNYNND